MFDFCLIRWLWLSIGLQFSLLIASSIDELIGLSSSGLVFDCVFCLSGLVVAWFRLPLSAAGKFCER